MDKKFRKYIVVSNADGISLKKITPGLKIAKDLTRIIKKNYSVYGKWLPFMSPDLDRWGVFKYLVKSKWLKKEPHRIDYGIYKNSEFIGSVIVFDISKNDRRCEIGYWLDVDYQNKGIVTAVIKNITDYLINSIGFERVQIICDVENEASKKIAEKSGYTLEGILRSYKYYPYFKENRNHCIYAVIKKNIKEPLTVFISTFIYHGWLEKLCLYPH